MIYVPWMLAFVVATGVLVVGAVDFGRGERSWCALGLFATGAALMGGLLYLLAFIPIPV